MSFSSHWCVLFSLWASLAGSIDPELYYSCHDQYPECASWAADGDCFPEAAIHHGRVESPRASRW